MLLQFAIYRSQGCCGTVHLRKEHIAAIPGYFDEVLAHFGRCGTVHVFEEMLVATAAGVVSDAGWALSSIREIEHVLDVSVVQPFDRGLLLPVVVKNFAPVAHDQVIVLVSFDVVWIAIHQDLCITRYLPRGVLASDVGQLFALGEWLGGSLLAEVHAEIGAERQGEGGRDAAFYHIARGEKNGGSVIAQIDATARH